MQKLPFARGSAVLLVLTASLIGAIQIAAVLETRLQDQGIELSMLSRILAPILIVTSCVLIIGCFVVSIQSLLKVVRWSVGPTTS